MRTTPANPTGPSPFTAGTRILAAGALLFGLLLGLGALLPGDWEAEASHQFAGTPAEVLTLVDSPEGWQRWTPWPDTAMRSGPARGEGATLSWDHPDMGDGRFEIVEVAGDTLVRYRVAVQEGSMQTRGSLHLEPTDGGTTVRWVEEGDFGWNPLMGYWALAMPSVQGEEMQKGLERLEAELSGTTTPSADAPR